ncbi:outer membrane protein TolC [Lentimicrobium saccharophilum]|uniref:Outer membrane protein TolC n=1 Tax=Lentimicrobium saccharophilum TaxID=1678841 RepID=A0A0S7BYM0_9BACT|nr:TolC family protein [Lentimicrobium saccharophilum]GAP43330.1 outer membrane protein TolC [Lentimicrobium saccharophilum]
MNKLIINSLILILAFGSQAAGQQQLSPEQCRKMALEKNEDLKIAGMQTEKANRMQAAARTLRLPSLSVSGTGIYQNKDFEMEMFLPTQTPNPLTGQLEPNIMVNPLTGQPVIGPDGNPVFNMYAWLPLEISLNGAYLAGISLEQPVYAGGRIRAGNQMADLGVEMAEENTRLQLGNTLEEADRAYWTFVSVRGKTMLAEQAVIMLEELVQLASNSYEVGMASRNDLLKAQAELNQAKLNRLKAQHGLELSRMDLCRVTGLPFDTRIIVTDTIQDTESLTPTTVNPEPARPENRPEYQLLLKKIGIQDHQIRMERAEFLPTAGVRAGYNHIGGIELSGTGFENTGFNVLASVSIPLFHWGEGIQKIKAARLEKEIRETELTKYHQLMLLEAEQARLNLILASDRIRMSKEALEQANENLRVSRDNYEVGMGTMSDLLIAQTQWQQAHSELIDARSEYKIKETAWLKVSGMLNAE